MKYREKFEVDKGWRFYRHRVSLLVQALAFGRRFTEEQLSTYVSAVNTFLDGVSGRTRPPLQKVFPLTKGKFSQIADSSFYKYVSDETLDYIKRGLFQFGTAQYYRDSENEDICDDREGMSTFHIGAGNNQLHISLVSGFNCAIFCGTATLSNSRELMRSRFGKNIVLIKDSRIFAARACSLLGAKDFYIYDVVYNDLKHYTLELDGIQQIHEIIRGESLNERSLREINRRFFQSFYDVAFMPSLFSKPAIYSQENERRMIFEMPADISSPTIVVESRDLFDLVEIV